MIQKKKINQLIIIVMLIAAVPFIVFLAMQPQEIRQRAAGPAPTVFLDTFDGNPSTPQPFLNSQSWDVAVHSRDIVNFKQLTPMQAHHGSDCGSPIDSSGNLVTHYMNGDYAQAVFKCKDHLMTSIRAGVHGAADEATIQPAEVDGYGVIYLTPNQIADFSTGEVVIRFDVTTWSGSARDWWDIWITPFDQNLQLPLYNWLPDLQGPPKNALHFQLNDMNGSGPGLIYDSFANFTDRGDSGGNNWWTSYESFMTTSPKQRTTFEFRISKTHIKAGIPADQFDVNGQHVNNGEAFWWIDKDIPALNWDKGVIQLGHHSYNPSKDCNIANNPGPDGSCKANTWHWDNVSISNATPFTIIPGDKRYIEGQTTSEVNFSKPAPSNAFLRYSQLMGNTQISFDNGQTWQTPQKQLQEMDCLNAHFCNMWTPIPAGTQKVIFKTTPNNSYWWGNQGFAKDFSIWSTEIFAAASTAPTPVPPTNTPVSQATRVALTLQLSGIGPNTTFLNPQKDIAVEAFNISNTLVGTFQGKVTYNSSQGNFQGTVDLDQLPTGSYILKVKTPSFLKKQVPGIISLVFLQKTNIPTFSLVVGDINNDNVISILDWQQLLNCFGSKKQTTSCIYPQTADLNDDSPIDGIDINLFLRTLAGRNGE